MSMGPWCLTELVLGLLISVELLFHELPLKYSKFKWYMVKDFGAGEALIQSLNSGSHAVPPDWYLIFCDQMNK